MYICKWCGDTVKNKPSDECDRCWEIRWQCENVPELVAKILSATNTACTPTGGSLPPSEHWTTPEGMPTPKVNLVPPTSG